MTPQEIHKAAARHTTLETTPLKAFAKGAFWGELKTIQTLSQKLQIPITTLGKHLGIPDDVIEFMQ
jgi:hypothetical protein